MLYPTDRRAIMFVDAGYGLKVMEANRPVAKRRDLEVDHSSLINQLLSRAETVPGCPVLRTY